MRTEPKEYEGSFGGKPTNDTPPLGTAAAAEREEKPEERQPEAKASKPAKETK